MARSVAALLSEMRYVVGYLDFRGGSECSRKQ